MNPGLPRAGVNSICCMVLMHIAQGAEMKTNCSPLKVPAGNRLQRYKLWKKSWWISLMNKNLAQTLKAWGGTLIPGKHLNRSWEGPRHFASTQLMQNDELSWFRSMTNTDCKYQNEHSLNLEIPIEVETSRPCQIHCTFLWHGAAKTCPYPMHNVHTCCKAWGPVSDRGNVMNCVLKFSKPFALWRVVPFTTVHRDKFKTFQGPITD